MIDYDRARRDPIYLKGVVDALHTYAWWQDGIQYVGSGVWTLKQALQECIPLPTPDRQGD